MSKYNNIINVEQAYPVAKIEVSNYFPLKDENITLTNLSTDVDTFTWHLNNGDVVSQNSVDSIVTFPIHKVDDTVQSLTINNTVGIINLTRHIYPIHIPTEAYYEFSLNTNVSREDEEVTITLVNKYNYVGTHSVTIVITDHITGDIVETIVATGPTETFTLPNVGIYDIEVQANTNSYIVYNKQSMILTVTKKLPLIGTAIIHGLKPTSECTEFYGVPYSKIDGANYNFTNQTIAPGSVIVIDRDENFPENSIYRLRISNLIGTPVNPIIVTIDRDLPLNFGFESYWGIYLENCKHVIIDGRGYRNIKYGINVFKNIASSTGVIGIQGGSKSTNIEIHNVECSNSEFSGITFKTDPNVDDPTTWRPTTEGGTGFTCYDLKLHNNYMHEMSGEGFYIGYFDSGTLTNTNSLGVTQTYRAHKLIDTKIYRNKYYRCGWDSIQLNNGYGLTEIAYNEITDSAWLGETNQNTGMSLSMEGTIVGNTINGCGGLGIQVLPFGTLSIYNNLIYNLPDGVNVLMLLGGEGNVPEVNVNETFMNTILIDIFNNNLISNGNGTVVSAQNVVQYKGVVLRNNVVQYLNNNLFSGQDLPTLQLWDTNKLNNINLVAADYPLYKMGSITDGNFNIYSDSILATGGLLIGDLYDIRGYKNWTIGSKFIGAYSGIIKLPADVLELSTVIIDNGAVQTKSRNITISYSSKGYPTHYMVSEDINFTGANWIEMPPIIEFTLSENDGTKTIYFKLKNSLVVSNVLSKSILYSESLRYLVNLSLTNTVYDSPAPWNNLNSNAAPIGLSKSNLIDQYSTESNLTITVVSPFDDYSSSAQSSEIYPYLAKSVSKNWVILKTGSASGIGTLQLSGCLPNKLYDILLYSNNEFSGGPMVYSVNGVEQVYDNSFENINSICTFNNVAPNAGNEINISVKPNQALTHNGELGLLDIKEHSNKPILNSILINSGDANTNDTTVTITVNQSIIPTEYIISENASFTGASWTAWGNNTISYTFISGNIGVKTIYIKLRNTGGESSVASDSINYLGTQLLLENIQINYGATLTPLPEVLVTVTFQNSNPTNYMISESPDFTGASWTVWEGTLINYTFLTQGSKTIYLKIQDDTYTTPPVSASIDYIILTLSSIVINNGDPTTSSQDVSVAFNYSGATPIQYKLSETANLASVAWDNWLESPVDFTLSPSFNSKTVYAQVKDNYNTSSIVSSSISYTAGSLSVNSFSINNGDAGTDTQNVTLTATYTGEPTQYMASEASDFTGASWSAFTGAPVSFVLSAGYGDKTIYFKLKTATDFESTAVSDVINYNIIKIVVSLAGPSYAASTYDTVGAETVNVLGYDSSEALADFQLKDVNGNNNGYFVVKPSEYPTESGFTLQPLSTSGGNDPALTGDTGVYPDAYINKHYYVNNAQVAGNASVIRFKGLSAGEYTVKLLKSSNSAYTESSRGKLNILCNDVAIVNPVADTVNNTTAFTTIKGITVTANGFLDIYLYNTGGLFYVPGLNLIEIKKEALDRTTRTFLLDLGSSSNDRNTTTPFNNLVVAGNDIVLNATEFSLNTTNNQKSNLKLVITSDNWVVQDNGISVDGTYLGTAMRDAFGVLYPNTGTMQITGCNDSKTYTIKIVQSRQFSGADVNTVVNGVLKFQDTSGNQTPLIWTDVTSTAGVINISTVSLNGGFYAQISVIEIIEV